MITHSKLKKLIRQIIQLLKFEGEFDSANKYQSFWDNYFFTYRKTLPRLSKEEIQKLCVDSSIIDELFSIFNTGKSCFHQKMESKHEDWQLDFIYSGLFKYSDLSYLFINTHTIDELKKKIVKNLNVLDTINKDRYLNFIDFLEYKPDVILEQDIMGFLHNHTTYTDGRNTLEEMISAYQKKRIKYVGISDHANNLAYGLNVEKIEKQHAEIDKLNHEINIKILKGVEVDIKENGDLILSTEVLKMFDYVIIALHGGFKQSRDNTMYRVIKGIENSSANILAHPSSRKLQKGMMRPGADIDMHKVIDACAYNKVAIEINGSADKLDLDWKYIEYAMKKNCMLTIDLDAHSVDFETNIINSLCIANRGRLEKSFCLNALSIDELQKYLIK